MFNIAVINIKDILKYLVGITITLCLVMFVARYFSDLEENKDKQITLEEKMAEVMQTSLLLCLDETIPAIKETNHELKSSDEEQINSNEILGNLLKIELAMFKQEQKIAEIQNSASNQIQNSENIQNTQIQTNQSQENQLVETSRRCNHTSCYTKSISR